MYDTIKECVRGAGVTIASMIEDEHGACSNELCLAIIDTMEEHINYMMAWQEVLDD